MKKNVTIIVMIHILVAGLFAASGLGTTSLELKGSVGPKLFLDVTQSIGAVPGMYTSIPLDQGTILPTDPSIGVDVGDWSVSSNTAVNLILKVFYTPFEATVEGVLQSIEYVISNGTSYVNSGDEFITLVRVGSVYREIDNSGSIYLKRVNSNSYLPSISYLADITFSLETE